MMWQPTSSAWKMFSSSRGLAQSSSAFGFAAQICAASRMSGTGSTPVSAMRPAKTETMAGASRIDRVDDVAHLVEREDGGDVELHAGLRRASR